MKFIQSCLILSFLRKRDQITSEQISNFMWYIIPPWLHHSLHSSPWMIQPGQVYHIILWSILSIYFTYLSHKFVYVVSATAPAPAPAPAPVRPTSPSNNPTPPVVGTSLSPSPSPPPTPRCLLSSGHYPPCTLPFLRFALLHCGSHLKWQLFTLSCNRFILFKI